MSSNPALVLMSFLQIDESSWGVGGALVKLTPFVRRIMGSTPALAAK